MQSITTEELDHLKGFTVFTGENVEEVLYYYDPNDTTYFIDVSFNALIEDLLYNNLTFDDILTASSSTYGDFIDIFYSEVDEIYIMVIGVR